MKNTLKLALLLAVLFLVKSDISAQDMMLIRGARDSSVVKVFEIGTDEIKYRTWPVDESTPLLVEKKDRVSCLRLQNGTILFFAKDEFSNEANYEDQHRSILKVDLFGFLGETTSIAYEQSIKPGMSWEVGAGFFGIPKTSDKYTEHSGILLRAGVKFMNTPDFYLNGMHYAHILKGSYIRPELVFVSEHATKDLSQTTLYQGVDGKKTDNTIGYAFMLNFGKQWILSDMLAIDYFVGAGIGAKKTTSTTVYLNGYSGYDISWDFPNTKGFVATGSKGGELSFVAQAGLKIGFLFGRTTSLKSRMKH